MAAEMAGFTTVGQCEWADYPTAVLVKHWPSVARWRDIRTLTGDDFYSRTGLRTVDVISGGFPCQPFSVAGKRRGSDDDRYLWPQMLRIIQELKPTWVVGENVAGIVNMALDTVYADMENLDYSVQTFIIPACALGAPHARKRCAIVAYNNSIRRETCRELQHNIQPAENAEQAVRPCDDVPDPSCERQAMRGNGGFQQAKTTGGSGENLGGRAQEHVSGKRRPAEPKLGRVADGVSRWLERDMSAPGYWLPEPVDIPRTTVNKTHRSARLKCLGNAVVPQQFFPIFDAIAKIERGEIT